MCCRLHGFALSQQCNSSGNVHQRRTDVDVQSSEVSRELWSGRAARQQEHFSSPAWCRGYMQSLQKHNTKLQIFVRSKASVPSSMKNLPLVLLGNSGAEEQISITIPLCGFSLWAMKGCAWHFLNQRFLLVCFSIQPEFSVMLKHLFNFPGHVKDFTWARIALCPSQEHCAWWKSVKDLWCKRASDWQICRWGMFWSCTYNWTAIKLRDVLKLKKGF